MISLCVCHLEDELGCFNFVWRTERRYHKHLTSTPPRFTLSAAPPPPRPKAARITEAGMRAGVALRPETPVSVVLPLLRPQRLVRCVDILAVQPGFGGQRFDSGVLAKVEELRSICPELDIQVPRPQVVPTGVEECGVAPARMYFAVCVRVRSDACVHLVQLYPAQRRTVALTSRLSPPLFPAVPALRQLQVDGGVSAATAQACVAAGANVLTSGSFIFGGSTSNADKGVAAAAIAELRGPLNTRWSSPTA